MWSVRLGLVLALLGCAEPAITSPLPPLPVKVGAAQQNNSYTISVAERTAYVTVAQVRDEGGESIHAFLRRMFAAADLQGAERLVLDLRSISGGDARLLVPLIRGITTRDRFLESGALVLVVGPNNVSPAQSAIALLQRYAHPTVVSTTSGV